MAILFVALKNDTYPVALAHLTTKRCSHLPEPQMRPFNGEAMHLLQMTCHMNITEYNCKTVLPKHALRVKVLTSMVFTTLVINHFRRQVLEENCSSDSVGLCIPPSAFPFGISNSTKIVSNRLERHQSMLFHVMIVLKIGLQWDKHVVSAT